MVCNVRYCTVSNAASVIPWYLLLVPGVGNHETDSTYDTVGQTSNDEETSITPTNTQKPTYAEITKRNISKQVKWIDQGND